MSLNPKKLVLLDRDGVINEDSAAYIKNPDEWHAIPGSLEAIASLNAHGIKVIIITNQSGLGRGFFSEKTLFQIHQKLRDQLATFGGEIFDIFFCPHHPNASCSCRKPSTGLLDELEKKYQISLNGVPFVGDTDKDLQLAFNKNCLPILVKTGKGQAYFSSSFKNDSWHTKSLVFDNLKACCDFLLLEHFSNNI